MTETPDGVPCKHCGQPIFWDEYCWTHENGWADCGVTLSGGTSYGVGILVNPHIDVALKTHAIPEGDWV